MPAAAPMQDTATVSASAPCRFITVVYEIVDKTAWGARNPLHYEHDGLKAVRVGLGDVFKTVDKIEETIEDTGACDRIAFNCINQLQYRP